MKKLLIGLILLAVFAFGGLRVADSIVKSGDDYYVEITNKGHKKKEESDNGAPIISYDYTLTGFDETGQEKEMNFTAFKERPLIAGAYLKVTWNQKRGVTSYKQVKESDIPDKAKEKLIGGN
ncbi:YxeA family protein [Tetragenococcus koreensis]|uniref:YxeA family protein n=1 Tax=Tetragenococcus koreensis TaxID=290335 RepID=UPI000F50246F|nr:YxeA family protein [Tetragenococcus koreensis]AYW45525.1 amino acid ABC transporter ATP-binding protein [Tetragenococcus koreensis]MCF1618207.1 YxeA family protein [Tetragenococcus koreensis]MCF1623032.1 YxeA family protein [Tetragenococcus koreensis]MCF1679033.1 YxeA family protein [Tetragenococcus koreensis]MCF1681435.1 YxeA family protein [Tetragenococcus koreensis]